MGEPPRRAPWRALLAGLAGAAAVAGVLAWHAAAAADVATNADADTLAAIQRDALTDLRLDLEAMRQPATATDRGGTVTARRAREAALRAEAEEARAAWSVERGGDEVRQRYDDARSALAEPDYVGYRAARTVVERWTSVRLTSPTTAVAVFVGYDDFRTASGWHADPRAEFRLRLVRQRGHWRLDSRAETGLDCCDPT